MIFSKGFIGLPILLLILVGLAIAGGAGYIAVQKDPTTQPPAETEESVSTSSSNTQAASTSGNTVDAKKSTTLQPGDIQSFNVSVKATNAVVGGGLIYSVCFAESSIGKYVAYMLVPIPETGTMKTGVLSGSNAPITKTHTEICGLSASVPISTITNGKDGSKFAVQAGTYKVVAQLYNTNPFTAGTLRFNGTPQPVATTESNTFTIQPGAPAGSLLETSAFVTPEGRAIMRIPRGWTVAGILLEKENSITVQFGTTNDALRPLVILYSALRGSTAPDANALADQQVEGLKERGAADITKTPVTISGVSGYAVEANMDHHPFFVPVLTHVKVLVLAKGNTTYLITGTAKQAVWNQEFPAISAAMNTAQFPY